MKDKWISRRRTVIINFWSIKVWHNWAFTYLTVSEIRPQQKTFEQNLKIKSVLMNEGNCFLKF